MKKRTKKRRDDGESHPVLKDSRFARMHNDPVRAARIYELSRSLCCASPAVGCAHRAIALCSQPSPRRVQRFQRQARKQTKVKIDKRFKRMFADADFNSSISGPQTLPSGTLPHSRFRFSLHTRLAPFPWSARR